MKTYNTNNPGKPDRADWMVARFTPHTHADLILNRPTQGGMAWRSVCDSVLYY